MPSGSRKPGDGRKALSEESLRSGRIARALLEASADMVSILSPDGRIIEVSERKARDMGIPVARLRGRHATEFMPPEVVAPRLARLAEVARTRQPVAFEERVGERVLTHRLHPVPDDDGEVREIVILTGDITQRRKETRALADSEEHYRRLFEMESDAIVLVDSASGDILDVNSAAVALYGYSRDEWLRMKHTDVSAEPDRTRQATVTCQTRIPLRWHRRKDGTVFPVEISAAHYSWLGRSVHVAAIRDVSERQRIEEALRESEERFGRAFQANPALLAITTLAEGRIVDANEAAYRITGYAREEAIGRTTVELGLWADPRQREDLVGRLRRDGVVRNLEVAMRCKSGAIRHALFSADRMQLRDQDYLLITVIDVTERVRMEARLRQAERMASLGTLVAGVAHEINNPNSLIALNAPTLQKVWEAILPILDQHRSRGGSPDIGGMDLEQVCVRVPGLLRAIGEASVRIDRTIRLLREYAQPGGEAGRVEAVQLNDIVETALRLCLEVVRKAEGRLDFLLQSPLPRVRGDAHRLEQVVSNLILNAAQALPDPGRSIVITTAYEPARRCVLLRIQDEGVGIPSEHLARLTEPFFTTRRDRGGTGLGLAISAAIVGELGGELSFDSVPGQGTTVSVRLSVVEGGL